MNVLRRIFCRSSCIEAVSNPETKRPKTQQKSIQVKNPLSGVNPVSNRPLPDPGVEDDISDRIDINER